MLLKKKGGGYGLRIISSYGGYRNSKISLIQYFNDLNKEKTSSITVSWLFVSHYATYIQIIVLRKITKKI